MAFYNKLSEVSAVSYPRLVAWRFRVKLHRIYSFHSYVTNSGPYYTYVLADEDVSVISSSLEFFLTFNRDKQKFDPYTLFIYVGVQDEYRLELQRH